MPHHFDDVAKALASATSRREALRRFGGGLLVACLTPLGLGNAWAGPGHGRGRGCGVLCQAATGFDPKDQASKAAFQACVEDCEACKESGGTPAIQEGGAVICDCPPPLQACDSVCLEPCPEGQTRNPETCECEAAGVCGPTGLACVERSAVCGTTGLLDLCLCFDTAEGGCACVEDALCRGLQTCATTAECPSGQICIVNTVCPVAAGAVCANPCGTTAASPFGVPEGPTLSGR